MYEQMFNLKSRPFTSTPYVQNYFAAESIHHALAQARLCIERASGPVIVTGPPGTGKSLVLAMLSEQFNAEYNVIALACTRMVERTDLLQNILFELRLPYRELSEGELRLSLIDHLKTKSSSGNGMLLLVDEAHSLSPDLLDELRLITNFIRDGRPQVSLVMAGTSALEDHLIETKSESFNQRIAGRCYLSNLRQSETFEYVVTHIDRAGGNGDELFTGEALKIIHQASQGCPRVINQICDYSLVLAARAQSGRITAEIVRQAWNEVQSIPGSLPKETSASERAFSNTSAKNTDDQPIDDNVMVVEFGQLDDGHGDGHTGKFSYSEIQHKDAPTSNQVRSERVHTVSNPDFGPVVEPRDATKSPDTMNPYDAFDEVKRAAGISLPVGRIANSSGLSQERIGNPFYGTFSSGDHSNTGGSENPCSERDAAELPNFENPFDEHFDHEEKVNQTFFPMVSEQNLTSLMLTPEQLSILDNVAARPAPTVAGEAHDYLSVCTADEFNHSPPQPFDFQDDIDDYENEGEDDIDSELKLSPEEISSLDRIEEDVRRLQLEYGSSRPTNARAKIQSAFIARSDNQPLEELMQTWSVANAEPKTGTATTLTREAESCKPQQRDKSGNESGIVNERTDDRDILIVNRPGNFRHSDSLDHVNTDLPAHLFTTGHATRMDYRELFQQLRQNQ